MSEEKDYDDGSSSAKDRREIGIVWDILFENKKDKESFMVLEKLLNKKIKVWCVLSTTVGGVRGTWKRQTGVLTAIDDEFIVLDNSVILNRKFIYRVEFA